MFDIQWPLVLFSLLAGAGGLAFGFAALSGLLKKGSIRSRFIASIAAMVLMVLGGCFSLLHLALPQNVMAAVTNVFSFSGISIELVLLGVTFILALVYAIVLKRDVSDTARNVIGIIGIVAALALAFFCGHGYIMESRPMWRTELLPVAYLGTALATGSFLFGGIQAAFGDADDDIAGMFLPYLAASVVALVCVALYVAFIASMGALEGSAQLYAVGSVLCAIAAMACALFLRKSAGGKSAAVVLWCACACSFLAGIFIRCFMWTLSNGFMELFTIAETTRTIFF